MTEVVKYSVVYQGSKLFWRTRHTIDITIVQHIQLDITEIIAFKPAINVEAKRIYLNSSILRTKLNQDEIDSKFSFAKQNNVPISVEFTDSVMHHAISDFILPRLIISELRKEERYFAVKVELRSSDISPEDGADSIDNLVCAQPAELQPYETKNHKRLAPGEVDAALKALEEEKCNLDAACAEAAVLEAVAHEPLSGKERWRIPIVLIKMDNGKVLSAGDAKIWEHVSRSLKTPGAIKRATAATVQTVTSPAQLAAEKAAKKPLTSFRQVVDATRPQHQQLDLTKVHAGAEARTREKFEHSARRASSSPRAHKSNENSARIPAAPLTSRLLASTAASHARANCAVEDSSPVVKGNHKKPLKRGNSKSVHANNSKRSLRMGSRPESRDNSDAAGDLCCASPEADHSGDMDHPTPLVVIGEEARGNFASQVAAGLSSFVASTFSTKNKPSRASFVGNNLPSEGSKNTTEKLPTESVAAFSDDTFVVEIATRHNSLKPDPIPIAATGTGDALAVGGVKPRAKPGKRSSYFGALLATLVRGDSGQAGSFARAASSESLTNADKAAGELPSQDPQLSKKPSAMSSWLPWKQFGNNAVSPVE
eukprot:CAMPEP_0184971994 /NCGR_PEP_ID=MMETSP1098-20130426/4079_1 /TAXON_ID=89044 /ORGANISM="Spumella elongata, Strain CCAP 955/1" /LENGTH=596 /DNA_ID=CAMNT_0027494205 /DNA_START=24 /DNA_END=1814 /DNA_ORIENTATION=-